jgi:hypothetical protein
VLTMCGGGGVAGRAGTPAEVAGADDGATAGGMATDWLPLRGTAGAIGALMTSAEPHCGHVTNPRACCWAKSSDEANQPSKRWLCDRHDRS